MYFHIVQNYAPTKLVPLLLHVTAGTSNMLNQCSIIACATCICRLMLLNVAQLFSSVYRLYSGTRRGLGNDVVFGAGAESGCGARSAAACARALGCGWCSRFWHLFLHVHCGMSKVESNF